MPCIQLLVVQLIICLTIVFGFKILIYYSSTYLIEYYLQNTRPAPELRVQYSTEGLVCARATRTQASESTTCPGGKIHDSVEIKLNKLFSMRLVYASQDDHRCWSTLPRIFFKLYLISLTCSVPLLRKGLLNIFPDTCFLRHFDTDVQFTSSPLSGARTNSTTYVPR